MDKVFLRFPGAILVSVLVAIILTLLPLSSAMLVWRPDWIALTFIYWAIIMPKRISLVLAWFTGLLMDVVSGAILGQYALGFTLVLYMALRLSERINPRIIWQQAFMIFIILGVYLLINLWILGVTDNTPYSWSYWLPLFSSIFVWPLWHRLLNMLKITRKHL